MDFEVDREKLGASRKIPYTSGQKNGSPEIPISDMFGYIRLATTPTGQRSVTVSSTFMILECLSSVRCRILP